MTVYASECPQHNQYECEHGQREEDQDDDSGDIVQCYLPLLAVMAKGDRP